MVYDATDELQFPNTKGKVTTANESHCITKLKKLSGEHDHGNSADNYNMVLLKRNIIITDT